jgi:multidrug efflux pump subunit AcrA (membrane-fusion protein)
VKSRIRAIAAVVIVASLATVGWMRYGRAIEPPLPTTQVTRGEFADVIEIRGEVRPVKTTLVLSPPNAGELVILKIARNGTAVKEGEVVAEFDAITMRQQIMQKQSELRGAMAEMDQMRAQTKITLEERLAAVRRAQFEVTKARLGVGDKEIVGVIEAERGRLAVVDAEQRQREAEANERAAKVAADAEAAARQRRIDLIKRDLARAEAAVQSLTAVAPIAGTVNILPNWRSASMMGMPAEFRPGDKTYAGSAILELPDLSEIFLVARVDETERGLLRAGQKALIRADAIADRDYEAGISDISLLARIDFSGGWPPTKQFDLKITLTNPDKRLSPGMSAVARINVGQIPDVLIVPTNAVFTDGGRPVVYRFGGRDFTAVPVEIVRRSKQQAAVKGDLKAGDRIALVSPVADAKGGQK